MSRFEDEEPVRFVDDPQSAAGTLLKRVPEPAAVSAARKQRLLAGIDERVGHAPARWPVVTRWVLVATACFAVGLGVGRWTRPPTAAPVVMAAAPPPAAPPRFVSDGHAELRGERVVLHDGRVVLEARDRATWIDVPGARAQVRAEAGSVVEVRLAQLHVQVSTYRGAVHVETIDFGTRELPAQRTWSPAGEIALAPAIAADIERALAGTPPPAPPTPSTTPTPLPPRVHAARPTPTPTPTPAPALAEPPPPAPEVAVASKLPVEETTPEPPPSALQQETEALRVAVRRLRHDHDAAGARVLLDDYLRAHPHGVLRTEAELARVDALLQLGNHTAALAALDRLPLDGLPRARELHVTRGELRAEVHRCREALLDLAPAADGDDGLAERALYRVAGCRATLGDPAHARADLASYLARFPAGRFAAEAKRAIDPR